MDHHHHAASGTAFPESIISWSFRCYKPVCSSSEWDRVQKGKNKIPVKSSLVTQWRRYRVQVLILWLWLSIVVVMETCAQLSDVRWGHHTSHTTHSDARSTASYCHTVYCSYIAGHYIVITGQSEAWVNELWPIRVLYSVLLVYRAGLS